MKTQSSRHKAGFTLVELLVVIAIIAVLAGAGFAAGNAAVQKAKKTTALATCTAIESAVNNFYTEYGSMPKDNLAADTKVDTKSDLTLLQTLLGMNTTLNSRAIKFLSVKEGKGNKNGLIYNSSGSTIAGLYDPWGGAYSVMLDGDYDETVTVKTDANITKILNGRRVAAWSNGADAVKTGGTTSGGAATDDVLTW